MRVAFSATKQSDPHWGVETADSFDEHDFLLTEDTTFIKMKHTKTSREIDSFVYFCKKFAMTTYTVTPSQTQDQTIARFELSPALEIVQASKYNNIDEAKDAPLVQQMFYLPFVKSVVLKKEALEIERFNILEWKDVLEDVSLEIENYLNKGGVSYE